MYLKKRYKKHKNIIINVLSLLTDVVKINNKSDKLIINLTMNFLDYFKFDFFVLVLKFLLSSDKGFRKSF